MKMSEHTKAPWSFHKDDGDFRIKNSRGTTIMCNTNYYPWNPDDEESWHLIAAAPELLEALKAIIANDFLPGAWNQKYEEIALEARKAIAKAEGKQ
jgi:hypothetical protein